MTGRLIDERLKNIDELRRREMELERLSRRLELALDTPRSASGNSISKPTNSIWDDRINELFGYPPDGGPRSYDALGARDPSRRSRARAQRGFPARRRRRRAATIRNTGCCCPTARCAISAKAAPPTRIRGAPARIVGVNWDVTADVALDENLKRANMLTEARNAELEAAKERIEFNALHDSLTGLPNRRYLDEVLAPHIEKFEPKASAPACCIIDLDRFKQINDTLGHAAGDAMLVHAARVLKPNLARRRFRRPRRRRRIRRAVQDRRRRQGALERAARHARRPHHRADAPAGALSRAMNAASASRSASPATSTRSPTRAACWSMPTSRSTGPRAAAATATSSSTKRCRPRSSPPSASPTTSCRAWSATSSSPTTSRSSTPRRMRSSASRRWRAGTIRPRACWRRPTSCKIAEELNVVATIDRMILEQTLTRLQRLGGERAATCPRPRSTSRRAGCTTRS